MLDYLLEHRAIHASARSCDTLLKKEIHRENLGSAWWSGGHCQGNGGDIPGNVESHAHGRLSRCPCEISGTLPRRSRAAARRKRPGEMRRLLPLRGRLPGRLHLHRSRRKHRELRISGGERYAKVYNIDYNRCIFCGYCVEACPTDAITHGHGFEIASYNTSTLIYRKEQMLVPIPAGRALPAQGRYFPTCRRPLGRSPPDPSMVLPSTAFAVWILAIVALLCLGSWVNTLKLAGKWRFEYFYYDFLFGIVICAGVAALALGSGRPQELTLQDNLLLVGYRKMAFALGSGVVLNLGMLLLEVPQARAPGPGGQPAGCSGGRPLPLHRRPIPHRPSPPPRRGAVDYLRK